MAKVQEEQLKDYEAAKEYYEMALKTDIYAVSIYPAYINLLVWTEDFEHAQKLIAFALTIKGIDKALIYYNQSYLHEYKGEYKLALQSLKEAKIHTYNACFLNTIKDAKARIESKMPENKKTKKKGKKKSKKN